MRQLRQKWNSQSGASILLALLFFLVCMMVAASILAAAVSNAGKIRSNYEEQQKYLALSSALRLVAGEIKDAKYTGKYKTTTWTEQFHDSEDPTIIHKIDYYRVEQLPGTFTCPNFSENTFSLLSELDGLFSKDFTGKTGYIPLTGATPPSGNTEKTLTVKADDSAPQEFKDQFPEVKVAVTMDKNRRIRLKAELTETAPGGIDKTYSMDAELTVQGAPTVEFSAGGALPSNDPPNTLLQSGSEIKTVVETPIPPVTWELSWIAKEVAGG